MTQQQIINFLKESPTHVSGEEMSERLNISRAAVWKYIDQLRQEGYDIAAVPHVGYKLESSPDKLLPFEITYQLPTKFMGQHVLAFDSLSSTMDEAFTQGLQGAPEGSIICAETQTQGRGRLGRKWMSPKGKGLYFSFILRPDFAIDQMKHLTLLTAVALWEAIEETTGVKTQIKWPNDILADGKKLAGILTEMRAEMDQVKLVVIGIGLNVNATASQLLPQATSLKMITGLHHDRVVLLKAICLSLEKWYQQFQTKGLKPVLSAWRKYCSTFDKRVIVEGAQGKIEGIAIDIDKDGHLLIKQASGKIYKHIAGDVMVPA